MIAVARINLPLRWRVCMAREFRYPLIGGSFVVALALLCAPSPAMRVALAQSRDWSTCDKASGDASIAACTRAIQSGRYRGSDLATLYYNRGRTYKDEKHDYDRAIADLSESIRLDPDAACFTCRGNAYKAKGEYDRAIADFNEAIRLDPKNADAYDGRGDAYKAKGDNDRAITDYGEAIRLDPKNATFLNDRANA